jgi:hypothetical protein
MGLYVNARNGSVVFMTRTAEDDDINTLDFQAVNSNVDVDARDHVTILEAALTDADMNIKSSGVAVTRRARGLMNALRDGAKNEPESLVSLANWVVSDGSNLNITALGDINILYNLNGIAEDERIAEREFTITNGSHATVTSTEGGVYILRDYDLADTMSTLAYEADDYVGDNIYVPDVLVVGNETEPRTGTTPSATVPPSPPPAPRP